MGAEMGRDSTKLYEASTGVGDSKDNVSVVTVMGTDKSREMPFELVARMMWEKVLAKFGVPVR
jgi:hypothetical protein